MPPQHKQLILQIPRSKHHVIMEPYFITHHKMLYHYCDLPQVHHVIGKLSCEKTVYTLLSTICAQKNIIPTDIHKSRITTKAAHIKKNPPNRGIILFTRTI